MKHTTFLTALMLVSVSQLWASGAEQPSANQILHQMSDKLAAAQTFSFEATRKIDASLIPGLNMPSEADVTATVQRPNKIAARSESDEAGVRRFVANGHTLYLLDEKKNLYAEVPMHTSIDGLVAVLDEKYGFVPPLAEFALSDPYKDFRRQAQTITYLGEDNVTGGFLGLGGVECYHLGLKGEDADAELWIGVSDLLPHKLVATFHRKGNPQLSVEFSSWNLNATATADDFTFTPPKGAMKIEMWTNAKMDALLQH